MKTFSEFLKESKNIHMTHLEDLVFLGGVKGTRESINFLRHLRNQLGGSKGNVKVSSKIDGAPSLIAGIDPNDGKFFVSKKSIFNKNPKVYKNKADVDADTKGDLRDKMNLALIELPKLGIKGILQGDFLYSRKDIKKVNINGIRYITFHPNTIVYAVPEDSDMGREIMKSKIGIAWHTSYQGSSFENMTASFGREIVSSLNKVPSIWNIDAMYQNVSGKASFNSKETDEVNSKLSNLGSIFNKTPANTLNGISENPELSKLFTTFVNTKIRTNSDLGDSYQFVNDLLVWIQDRYEAEAEKRKTERGKEAVFKIRDEVLTYFEKNSLKTIANVIDIYKGIQEVKLMLIKKYNEIDGMTTFLKTKDGFQVTNQEGFVAVNDGQVVKLIDRLEFSHANFSSEFLKGWQR